jgi:hypothetical protein
MPNPPTASIHGSTAAFWAAAPVVTMLCTEARGPIEFATSFEPWAKATAQAVMICSTTKTRSTWRKWSSSPGPPARPLRGVADHDDADQGAYRTERERESQGRREIEIQLEVLDPLKSVTRPVMKKT